MLYPCLKIYVRLLRPVFCRLIIIDKPELLKQKGPLLLAANHPNSFLDAVILDSLFEQPIWSLARGDVFKNKIIGRILKAMKILPVYRVSEGVENLSSNYETFDACKKIFRDNGLVLIFSEGICVNEWHLRPLKKGTARLVISSWEDGIPVKVLPVCINYSSFRSFGKNLFISFGNSLTEKGLPATVSEGARIQAFNNELRQQLEQGVYEIPKNDLALQTKLLERRPSRLKQVLLAIPALAGCILHAPLYQPIKRYTLKKAAHNDHYDSILTALLFITYLPYLLLLSVLLYYFTHSLFSFFCLLLIPFSAWSYVQLKSQIDS
ncbi:MAG TPA: 1-acyl-sn-glycerol-3-phosphate acyltransferase [Chitinophagaceae bacterium]|nr:1-acyl-sn-glycerol-3-phosphate acyltransferase [Chitinophagaceae bacterium]